MVETVVKMMTRGERAKARMGRMKTGAIKVEGVRVEPCGGEGYTADDMRRLLKHPSAGGFRSEGSIEWPNDTFTKRRLREGSVKLAEAEKKEPEPELERREPEPARQSEENPAA